MGCVTAPTDGESDWSTVVQQYAEQVRAQFDQFHVGTAKATENLNELWGLYTEELRRMGMTWMEPLQRAPGFMAFPGVADGSGVVELTNLYWDAFERTFGGLLQSPGLGLTRELNEKIAHGFDSWLDFRRASADYQSKLGDMWSEAFEQLMHEMKELSERGEMVSSVRGLLLLWGQVADRVFVKTFRTDEYVQIQGQMLNAAMAYRVQVREIMEYVLNALDLPTRSEVDEAHRNIYELRREVKALKKELAALRKSARKSTSRRKPKAAADAPDPAAETTEEA
ncbi:MAG: class III poly(R)-hydroxyalkanoic acid synthase subunit PhaE [Anaerolineae bacterium]|nr:class III poly(R)-hydroxyalkanoic acid synthase subunit PhaE [Anaerolineae bacterium]